jgi:hypothetical protein
MLVFEKRPDQRLNFLSALLNYRQIMTLGFTRFTCLRRYELYESSPSSMRLKLSITHLSQTFSTNFYTKRVIILRFRAFEGNSIGIIDIIASHYELFKLTFEASKIHVNAHSNLAILTAMSIATHDRRPHVHHNLLNKFVDQVC